MGIEFKVAAEAANAEPDEDYVEVPIEDKVYHAYRPTVAQTALLNLSLNARGTQRLEAVFDLVKALMGQEALEHVQRLVWNRQIDLDDLVGGSERNPEGGLIDQIFEEFAGRPTEPSTASSPSRTPGGRRSTGRSPGKGSTRSTSRSTDS